VRLYLLYLQGSGWLHVSLCGIRKTGEEEERTEFVIIVVNTGLVVSFDISIFPHSE
jgi:hypothetical protein